MGSLTTGQQQPSPCLVLGLSSGQSLACGKGSCQLLPPHSAHSRDRNLSVTESVQAPQETGLTLLPWRTPGCG
jgi:hypothetical protein